MGAPHDEVLLDVDLHVDTVSRLRTQQMRARQMPTHVEGARMAWVLSSSITEEVGQMKKKPNYVVRTISHQPCTQPHCPV